jgi:hypothetical protein
VFDNTRANAGDDAKRAVAPTNEGLPRFVSPFFFSKLNTLGNVSGTGKGASDTKRSLGARYRSNESAASRDAKDEAALAKVLKPFRDSDDEADASGDRRAPRVAYASARGSSSSSASLSSS